MLRPSSFDGARRRAIAGARAVTLVASALVVLAVPAGRSPAADTGNPVAELEAELARTKSELSSTRARLAETEGALEALTKRVDAMQSGPAPGAGVPAASAGATARLAPVNADNPAISFVVDVQGRSNTTDGDGAGFALGSGELFISAPIDPFLRGYAALTGTSEEGFDIEEAALVTTALPGNFTVKGGRFFADVGRLSHWHDEALPFVDRPPSLDRLVGGESGAEGLELSWLSPFEPFFQITGGLYNSIGSERREGEGGPFSFGKRSFSELTFLVRPHTFLDLTDSLNVELGGTYAVVPQDSRRRLYGLDAVVRHQPGTSSFYQGTVVGAEWLWNHERFRDAAPVFDGSGNAILLGDPNDPATPQAFESQLYRRTGGYAYFESFFARRFSGGFRFDLSQALRDDEEIDADGPARFLTAADWSSGLRDEEETYSLFVTWMPSEFHRLRLQGDHIARRGPNDQRVTLQWTAFIGSHAHGFNVR